MRHIAFEGRCFVLSACQYIRRGDFPADYPAIQGADPQTVLIRGGSVIVNPLGCVLAGPDYSGEKILTADLDPGEVAEGKFDLDVAGHYARRKGIKSCRGSADLSKSYRQLTSDAVLVI
jgi:nitrilase